MARLPQPGSDSGTWGDILNEFMLEAHNADGSAKSSSINTSALQDGAVSLPKIASSNTPTNGQVLSYNGTQLIWVAPSGGGGGGGVTDHGALTGLSDDDHPQYHTDARGDARYFTQSQVTSALNGKQNSNADLTAISGLTPANDDILQRKAGAWTNRTPAQLKTDLTLTKSDVGLGNVDNTSDANKPISSATQTALNGKANTSHTHTLDDLSDVAVSSPSVGQVIKYNGSAWVNDIDSTSGGAGATNLSATPSATDVVVASDTGTDATIASATTSNAGVMSAADKSKLNGIATGAQVNTVDSVAGKTGVVSLVKADVGLGNVDNTSDANKPVSTATQTALNGKANTSHTHTQSESHNSADTDSSTTALHHTIGTGANQAAAGNHGHAAYVDKAGGNIATLADSSIQYMRVNIPDDGTATSGWPDRYANYFNGTRTGYFNEYGEVRARPAKNNTVAMRAMGHTSGTANIFEVTNTNQSSTYLSVSSIGATLGVPLSSTANISTTGTVTGTNIGNKVTASATPPSSPAVGDVWVDLSA